MTGSARPRFLELRDSTMDWDELLHCCHFLKINLHLIVKENGSFAQNRLLLQDFVFDQF